MGDFLGDRIRFLREKHQLSQKQLAAHLNISNVQLSRYESGSRTPDPEIITRFASFFKVSTDFLLGLTPSIQENHMPFIKNEDIQFLQAIKSIAGLEEFIRSVIQTPKDFEKLNQIWKIIKDQ
ncbi:transcriptional regulator with XRE-family HTH domain [Pullulanibacillus pueri]|uniref:Transcriptional regulator n=1 Tax=Pullulanibacillus pueri TaxID=1437324 RepID=A0A8J2ZSI4_9BACL|nr:helix-turn-helix transcriptional regulator [Pullulanibacillus pueri]MBM7680441.1 transcriptional regulator with XRE-family HTH domain [Pullulanibacillus pueri]GGH75074.1 transcriptional regulator [Pullulanibacillus pueri]